MNSEEKIKVFGLAVDAMTNYVYCSGWRRDENRFWYLKEEGYIVFRDCSLIQAFSIQSKSDFGN